MVFWVAFLFLEIRFNSFMQVMRAKNMISGFLLKYTILLIFKKLDTQQLLCKLLRQLRLMAIKKTQWLL